MVLSSVSKFISDCACINFFSFLQFRGILPSFKLKKPFLSRCMFLLFAYWQLIERLMPPKKKLNVGI